MSWSSEVEAVQIELVKKVLDHSTMRMPGEVQMYKMYIEDALSRIREITERLVVGEDEAASLVKDLGDGSRIVQMNPKNKVRTQQRITLHETQEGE